MKLRYWVIILSLISILSCKSEEAAFLEHNKVLFCKTTEFEKFVDSAIIKPEKAKKLMIDYAKQNNLPVSIHLYFIVNEFYVFTNYVHPKIPETSTKGIWVHANTGEVKENKNGIFLKAYNKFKWKVNI